MSQITAQIFVSRMSTPDQESNVKIFFFCILSGAARRHPASIGEAAQREGAVHGVAGRRCQARPPQAILRSPQIPRSPAVINLLNLASSACCFVDWLLLHARQAHQGLNCKQGTAVNLQCKLGGPRLRHSTSSAASAQPGRAVTCTAALQQA